MNFITQFNHKLSQLTQHGMCLAEEMEAGQADSPFVDEFERLRRTPSAESVKGIVIGVDAEATYAALSSLLGQEYNVCKVFVPSRLGFSEVLLQERGFLVDTGNQRMEFDDMDSFVNALRDSRILHDEDNPDWMDPLRLRLKAAAHLSGLSLLVPDSIDSIVKKPALLSTLADQADWLFLAGYADSLFSKAQKSALQLLLNTMIGFQGLLVDRAEPSEGAGSQNAWWQDWRVNLSLGVVNVKSDLLAKRLAMLTSSESELRCLILEFRRAHRVDAACALLSDELQQQQKRLKSKARLLHNDLDSGASDRGSFRRSAESSRTTFNDEFDHIKSAIEQQVKQQLSPNGFIYRQIQEAAHSFSADEIEQTIVGRKIKLGVNEETRSRYAELISRLSRKKISEDLQLLEEGLSISLKSIESDLEELTGFRTKLSLEPLDVRQVFESTQAIARPEIKYRGEMEKPTLMKRFQSARQGIMGMMMLGMVFTGISAISSGGSGSTNFRSYLYAAMLPLLILGFLYTYISFRKKDAEMLEREVERLHDGVFSELRRIMSDVLRQEQILLTQHYQKQGKQIQRQIAETLEQAENLQSEKLNEIKRKSTEQKQLIEQRSRALAEAVRQSERLSTQLEAVDTLKVKWLADWISRFNQGKTP